MLHSGMRTSESDRPKMHKAKFTTDLFKGLKGLVCSNQNLQTRGISIHKKNICLSDHQEKRNEVLDICEEKA